MISPVIKAIAATLFEWRQKRLTSLARIRFLVFLHDVWVIPLAWALAYWLRFNLGKISPWFMDQALQTLPVLICIQAIFYWLFGLYRGIWRFASLPDLMRIVKVVVAGCGTTILLLFLTSHLVAIPRSIFPLYGLLLIVFLTGSRIVYRWLKDYAETNAPTVKLQRILVVGAGKVGEGMARDLVRHCHKDYQVVAFVDDDPAKIGQEIHGVRVVGTLGDMPEVLRQQAIDLVMIAMPSARSADMRRIVSYCEQAKVLCRTLPSIQDLASGHVQIDAFRAVSLEDLLGREPVTLDWQTICSSIQNQCVLVSGGGGSIGAELCRQIARFSPQTLHIVEQNEFNLYALSLELQQTFPGLDFRAHLLDVTDKQGVSSVFQQHAIDVVFHAAAYKHVPILENQLRVAVKNNILGTQVLAETAVSSEVKKFILISTDKAVNPANIMGATKRIAEIFCQNYGLHTPTQFITVRFGNVLGSAGSVVPLFKQQIEAGGPLTVTHPEITRFFMTIPEAAQLILQSSIMGGGGEIFVLDMGEPVKIQYLAEQMIVLAGLTLGQDIHIQYIGLRPGEKLYEELFHEAEPLITTSHEKIMKAAPRHADWQILLRLLHQMESACQQGDISVLSQCLQELVPEYQGKKLKVN